MTSKLKDTNSTSIRIDNSVIDVLALLRSRGDTYSDVIKKLLILSHVISKSGKVSTDFLNKLWESEVNLKIFKE